jgi:hypothetical protein
MAWWGGVEGGRAATLATSSTKGTTLLVSVLGAMLLLPAVSANSCPVGPSATLLSFGNVGFVNAGNLSTPTTILSGCAYDFYLPDRSELYLKLRRPSENHTLSAGRVRLLWLHGLWLHVFWHRLSTIECVLTCKVVLPWCGEKRGACRPCLWVKWDYKYEYKPPMHVFSWDGQCCQGRAASLAGVRLVA